MFNLNTDASGGILKMKRLQVLFDVAVYNDFLKIIILLSQFPRQRIKALRLSIIAAPRFSV